MKSHRGGCETLEGIEKLEFIEALSTSKIKLSKYETEIIIHKISTCFEVNPE